MIINYIYRLKQISSVGGLSQRSLAARLDVTTAALSRWLHGHAKPRPTHIAAIERLHREMVHFPAFGEARVQEALRSSSLLKRRKLWNQIAQHTSLLDELLLDHTYNSTSIEGTTLTKRETEAVLFSKVVILDKSLIEHLEVSNHGSVLKKILCGQYKGPITEDFILLLHKELLQGIRDDAGSYSRYPRAIRGLDIALTHPRDIPEEMAGLIASWSGGRSQKNLRDIADFHVRFELIHPFGDGNGRLGRLLMVLQCLRYNYPPVIIENIRKADYYDTLEYAQKKSIGPFLCFLAEEMGKTIKVVQKYLAD